MFISDTVSISIPMQLRTEHSCRLGKWLMKILDCDLDSYPANTIKDQGLPYLLCENAATDQDGSTDNFDIS